MWAHIKELGLLDSIPADLIGQYGCRKALGDRLGSALHKRRPRQETVKEDRDFNVTVASPTISEGDHSKDETESVKSPEQREAERRASREAVVAALSLAKSIGKLEVVCFTETKAPLLAGAAKGVKGATQCMLAS
jgi:hypothetical protein